MAPRSSAQRRLRRRGGFRCPKCDRPDHYIVVRGSHKLLQCHGCRHQTSVTAGTALHSTKLPLSRWFLAIYLISQAKSGLSALALKRQLGVSYPTAWLVHHKRSLLSRSRYAGGCQRACEGNWSVKCAILEQCRC